MKCSIVIRSYNEAAHIGRLLLGIGQQTIAADEVILVDSGSTDGTVEVARSFGVRVIEIDKHSFSFGRALNVGCRAASGEVLVFASAHVYPTHRTWLESLLAPFGDDRVVLSYGKQRGNHLNKFSEHQIFSRWFPEASICPQSHFFCNNANCAIRRAEWQRREYDETLTGLEDLAWAKQAQADGGWIAYVANAGVIHVHDETWSAIRNRYRREAIALKGIQDGARFTSLDFAWLLASNVFVDLRQAAHQRRLGGELTDILLFRFNQFLGTYKGFNGPELVSEELRRRFYFPTLDKLDDAVRTEAGEHLIDYDTLEQKVSQVGMSPRSGPSAADHDRRG